MSSIYIFVVIALVVLAIIDIIVGVANDAINFLNSALGSKVAPHRVILSIAAIGILVGTLTSSGMMEVARSGVFYPAQFTFNEVMLLFLGMMLGDVILLNMFNSLGLPTSTTVSMVFGLLGSAVGITLHRIALETDLSLFDISQFINAGRAMMIISAILVSVVVAFTAGTIIMYISRLIFSFRYNKSFKVFGAAWCGISIAVIIYFTIFKGLRSSGLISTNILNFINDNIFIVLSSTWAICSLILFAFQKAGINILKITILAGTFSLALAFAGNDLVNFIGVPLAGVDSFMTANSAGTQDITMESLMQPTNANFFIILISGVVMALTLFFSKKAMRVAETELQLSSQNERNERFGSTYVSRFLVRLALSINNLYRKITPGFIQQKIANRFEQLPEAENGNAYYDLIRGTVNMTAASVLISAATAVKLPLSTTYVVFMVAMGSSLADRAWGRESAVYRITGVMAVISGWFITAFGGFIIAFTIASILIWGGNIVVVIVTIACFYMLVHNNFLFPKKRKNGTAKKMKEIENAPDILENCIKDAYNILDNIAEIYKKTLIATFEENRKVLSELTAEADKMFITFRNRKYEVLPTLKHFRYSDVNLGYFYVQIVDYLSEITKSILHTTRSCFAHINNSHQGWNKEQMADLMDINNAVAAIHMNISEMLRTKNFEKLDYVLEMRDNLFTVMTGAIKNELKRVKANTSRTKTSLLYLTVLNETKTLVLQSRNLLKSQKHLLEN
ncbi:MAG: inorganic phosphate transporter [Bacteroidales bacterium]|jgi:phosphate/sulfate permease/ribosomal protein S17E|nr:inorganic phosphate transporter [Bacteroidales bacterium]